LRGFLDAYLDERADSKLQPPLLALLLRSANHAPTHAEIWSTYAERLGSLFYQPTLPATCDSVLTLFT
jgi:hypothetical protein